MSSRSKKDDEWEERIIGFEQLDENYGNVFMTIFADYRPFCNMVNSICKNTMYSMTKQCRKV